MNKWHKFQPLPDNIRQSIHQLTKHFATEGVLLAYLFGSLAHHDAANDVDLALLMPAEKRPFHLHPRITETLGTERVDIVDLRRASPVLAFEIVSSGQCIYAANDTLRLDFELHTVRQYKDTAWLRRNQEQMLNDRMAQWSLNATASPSD